LISELSLSRILILAKNPVTVVILFTSLDIYPVTTDDNVGW